MNEEQLQFVQGELARGVSRADLYRTLLQAGYTNEQVNQLFAAVTQSQPVQPSVVQVTQSAVAPALEQPEAAVTAHQPTGGWPGWVKVLLGIVIIGVVVLVGIGYMLVTSTERARLEALDASYKQNMLTLRSQAELHFVSNEQPSYAGLCGVEAVVSVSDNLQGFSCVASNDQYRMFVTLSNSDYYCIDAVGVAEVMTERPMGLSCEQDV